MWIEFTTVKETKVFVQDYDVVAMRGLDTRNRAAVVTKLGEHYGEGGPRTETYVVNDDEYERLKQVLLDAETKEASDGADTEASA